MKMMPKRVIALLVILLVICVGVVVFCLPTGKGDIARLIPNDAVALARIQPQALHEMLPDLMAADAEALGISQTKPSYAFLDKKLTPFAVVPLQDEDKFRSQLEAKGYQLSLLRNYDYAKGEYSVLIDEDFALVAFTTGTSVEEDLLDYAKPADEPESVLVGELPDYPSPVSVSASGRLLFNQYVTELLPFDKKSLSALSGAVLTGSLSRNDEELVAELSLKGTDDASEQFVEELHKALRPIEGNLLNDVLSDSTQVALCLNVQGDAVLQFLRKIPACRLGLLALNMYVEVNQLIQSIDGDVAIAAKSIAIDEPRITLHAELDNTDFLHNDWNVGGKSGFLSCCALSPTDFQLTLRQTDVIKFGVKDEHVLYITTEDASSSVAPIKKTAMQVRDARLFLQFDASILSALMDVKPLGKITIKVK